MFGEEQIKILVFIERLEKRAGSKRKEYFSQK